MFLGLLTAAALVTRVAFAAGLPAFDELRASLAPSDAILRDRNGAPLSEVELDPRGRRLGWVSLAELSPAVPAALLAAEDRRFLEHAGVDWQALAGALWDNLWRAAEGRRLRGASTLSMQLAGLLDPALHLRAGSRTLAQKWDQARAARELERTWTKSQILEAYLNLAPFRGGLRGVHEAAQGLFRRHPAELGAAESLVLGALLRGPNAAPEVVVRRACAVAASVAVAPRCAVIRDIAMAALTQPARLLARRDDAPHLARLLLHGPGEEITVSVDAAVQRQLRDLVAAADSAGTGAVAAVVLDNASGEVLAWVGGADPDAADGVLRPRVLDGALDPLLAAVALERRLLTAASPLDLPLGGGGETGPTGEAVAMRTASLRQALADDAPELSGILARVNGAEVVAERLRLFGFEVSPMVPTPPPGPAFDPPAVTLLQLANAYRALVNGGEWRALGLLRSQTAAERRRALRPEAAFVAADLLVARAAGNDRPALRCGVERGGTEAVCAAFNERYTVALAASGRPSAEALVRRVLHSMAELQPAMPARVPAGVTARMVGYEPAVEGPRREWFLAGTETLQAGLSETTRAVVVSPRIQHPAEGEVLALPPIAGRETGRVVPRAGPEAGGTQWRLDGAVVSSAQRRGFAATPGQHRLELLGSSGEVLDAVRFEVVQQ